MIELSGGGFFTRITEHDWYGLGKNKKGGREAKTARNEVPPHAQTRQLV